jgi:hypothetical protein
MGFKSLIEKQVQGAMRILGNDDDGLARRQNYTSVTDGVYDPATRAVTTTEVVYRAVPMAMVRFSIDDMDEEVRPQTDRVALIASLDLPVTPNENDKITAYDGNVYTVKRIMSDPADALYKLHVRRE